MYRKWAISLPDMGKFGGKTDGLTNLQSQHKLSSRRQKRAPLLGGDRLSADQKGKLWEIWSHFPESAAL